MAEGGKQMNIIKIKREEQIEQGKTYLEILQDSLQDTDIVKYCSVRYLITGKPVAYEDMMPGEDAEMLSKSLYGSRWIKAVYVCDDGSIFKGSYHSLSDMGITDRPYNNHKLYYVAPEDMDAARELTIAEFKTFCTK